jgi:hypothetical protein
MADRIKQLQHSPPIRPQSPSDLDPDKDLKQYLMSGSGKIPSMEASGDELKKDTIVVGQFLTWPSKSQMSGEMIGNCRWRQSVPSTND